MHLQVWGSRGKRRRAISEVVQGEGLNGKREREKVNTRIIMQDSHVKSHLLSIYTFLLLLIFKDFLHVVSNQHRMG